MDILGAILIVILLGVEVYCGAALYYYCKWRSEQRTNARRAIYRAKAYKELAEKRTLKNSRETLWNAIRK